LDFPPYVQKMLCLPTFPGAFFFCLTLNRLQRTTLRISLFSFKLNMNRLPLTAGSVVDRHRFDADTDSTFNFDATLDPDPTLSFAQVGKLEIFV
jgi:hypothetical protein